MGLLASIASVLRGITVAVGLVGLATEAWTQTVRPTSLAWVDDERVEEEAAILGLQDM